MPSPLGILQAVPIESPDVLPWLKITPETLHITLAWGVTEAEHAEFIGLTTSVYFTEECWSDRIQAVRCTLQAGIPFAHEVPHCSISWADGVKPVESTAMLQGPHTSSPLDLIVPCEIKWVELKDSVGAYRQKILDLLYRGHSLNKACVILGVAQSTARGWFSRLPPGDKDRVRYEILVKGNKSLYGGWKLGRSRNHKG